MATRREQLLEATIGYLLEHGVGDVSLRPLAAALGTKARLLIYHFGSRDALVSEALSLALQRVQTRFLDMFQTMPLERALLEFWKFATGEDNAAYLRLIFEVHGLATHHPEMFGSYVRESLESWRRLLKGRKAAEASIIIAVFDGLLFDYLATGDLARNTRALRKFIKGGLK